MRPALPNPPAAVAAASPAAVALAGVHGIAPIPKAAPPRAAARAAAAAARLGTMALFFSHSPSHSLYTLDGTVASTMPLPLSPSFLLPASLLSYVTNLSLQCEAADVSQSQESAHRWVLLCSSAIVTILSLRHTPYSYRGYEFGCSIELELQDTCSSSRVDEPRNFLEKDRMHTKYPKTSWFFFFRPALIRHAAFTSIIFNF